MPADGIPIVGFTPDVPGLYLAVMHAGVVMAPVVGRLATGEIVAGVRELIGEVSGSSIRSYLRLNTPQSFARPRRRACIESDLEYFDMACQGIPRLRNYQREQADMFQTL